MLNANSFALVILCLLRAIFAAAPLPIDADADAADVATLAATAPADSVSVLQQAEPIATLIERLSLNVYAADLYNSADRQQDMELSPKDAADLAEEAKLAKLAKRELSVIGDDAPPADEDFDLEVAEIHVFRPAFRYSVEYAKKVQNQRQRQQQQQQIQQFG